MFFEERKLFEMLNDTDESAYDRFKDTFPDHWLSIKADKIRIAILKPDQFKGNNRFEKIDIPLLYKAIKNVMYRSLDAGFEASFFQPDTESIGVIFLKENSGDDEIFEFMQNYRISVKHHLNISISISYSGSTDEILALKSLYDEVKELFQYRYIFGAGSVIDKKHCLLNLGNKEMRYPNELDGKLTIAINNKDFPQIALVLDDIKNILCGFQYMHINICSITLVNNVIVTLCKMENNESYAEEESFHDLYKRINDIEFINDFFTLLKTFIYTFLGNSESETKSIHENKIASIIAFVQDNYNNPNLSSRMIGDFLGFSNNYLMYRFLESTGITLNEYIINVRMRKAASLLQNTALPIIEIARQIGINNDNYFYKLFKKVYHCTPREFTEKYNVIEAANI
jgi:AraC-like DNA-binding protein